MTGTAGIKQIPIDMIDPNPHRDFHLSRIINQRVERLMESYRANEDFGVLPVRSHPDKKGRYQLVGGHHRHQALKRLGIKKADAKVLSYDDNQMLEAMIDENAGQDEKRFSVVVEAVAAVMMREAERLISKTFENKSDKKAQQLLLSGAGLGETLINRHVKGRFSLGEVREAIKYIKESDVYLSLMKRVDQSIKQQFAKASEQRKRSAAAVKAIEELEPTVSSTLLPIILTPSQSKAVRDAAKKTGVDAETIQSAVIKAGQDNGGNFTYPGLLETLRSKAGQDPKAAADADFALARKLLGRAVNLVRKHKPDVVEHSAVIMGELAECLANEAQEPDDQDDAA